MNNQKTNKKMNEIRQVHVNLGQDVWTVWKAHYGQDLTELISFGDTYHNIGVVWMQSVDLASGQPLYTTTNYPPSVSDEYAITLPHSAGVVFPLKKMTKNALYW